MTKVKSIYCFQILWHSQKTLILTQNQRLRRHSDKMYTKKATQNTPTSPQSIWLICQNWSKHLGYVGKKVVPGVRSLWRSSLGDLRWHFFRHPRQSKKRFKSCHFITCTMDSSTYACHIIFALSPVQ